jgi:hypothetical protein
MLKDTQPSLNKGDVSVERAKKSKNGAPHIQEDATV